MEENNKPKQITYPTEEKENIFTKLINFIRRLQLITHKNRKIWSYFLYGTLLLALGIIVWATNK